MLALLKVGQLAQFVTQLGIAALVVVLALIIFAEQLKDTDWGSFGLIVLGAAVFYFSDYFIKAINFKIQALDISTDIGVQTPSLALLGLLLLAAIAVATMPSLSEHLRG
jgi:hypothetical protein